MECHSAYAMLFPFIQVCVLRVAEFWMSIHNLRFIYWVKLKTLHGLQKEIFHYLEALCDIYDDLWFLSSITLYCSFYFFFWFCFENHAFIYRNMAQGSNKKKSEFRDVREKSFSTFWFHFFLRNYAFPGSNLSVASNACTESPPHGVNVTSNQKVRKCLPFRLKSLC